jgi:hypothetical protein
MSRDNGVNLALAAMGLLAAASITANKRKQAPRLGGSINRHRSGSCSHCGGPLKRGSMSKVERINLTAEQQRAKRRAEQTQFMSEGFYVQRMDAKAWFTATESDTMRVVGKDAVNLKRIQMEAMKEILMAMGATEVQFSLSAAGKKKKAKGQRVTAADYSVSKGPSKVVGTLDYSRARPLVAAVHRALWNKGVKRTISTGDGGIENIPIMTLDEVVESRIKMDSAIKVKSLPTAPVKVTGATWKKQFKVAWFVASLYSQNVWTLHMLDNLKPTLVPIMGYGNDKGMVDDLSYRLVLPERMVDGRGNFLPKFKHLKGIEGEGWKTALLSADVIAKSKGGDKNYRPKIKIFLKRGGKVVPARLFNISDSGRMNAQFQQGQSEVALFSKTSKMSAPSFSLPAGNPQAGGTCIMAAKDPETGQEMDLTICNKCYATNNNYTYASSVYSTSVRLGWVNECLDKRNLSSQKGSLADKLTAAIIAYAVLSTDGEYDFFDSKKKVIVEQLNPKTGKKQQVKRSAKKLLKDQKGRQTMEIGVWDAAAKKIQTPSGGLKKKMYANTTPILRGAVSGMTYKTTADFFADTLGSDGSGTICGFFRIHDAGDFTVLRQNSYIEAWNEIAANLPHVMFWAPTRVWATNKKTSKADRSWLRNCLRWGAALEPQGSRSLRRKLAAGLAGTIKARIANYLIVKTEDDPEECSDIIETLVEIEDSGGANTPGESGGRLKETGQNNMMVNYVPNPATVNRLRRGAQLDNYSIRPSSLYVKTSTNPAFIPSVSGLDAGSGVNKIWRGEASERELKANGIDPKSYVPVFSCDGQQAYQCPVYSKSVVLDANNKPVPDGKGGVEMAEAASCQAAGCRACWLWPNIPITYGAH